MDTLHDRLTDLAEDAPTGGAPAADLWARGKRTHRLRVAGLAAAVLVVGAAGTGIGVRLADGDDSRSDIEPAGTVGISLPVEYPLGEELPDLGDAPGPLAAIWMVPRGGELDAVGLVAETGKFGTLPIDVVARNYGGGGYFALSPDGRRIAYDTPAEELVVGDLVTGDSSSLAFEDFKDLESDYTWVDSTHLVGHRADGGPGSWVSEADGWVWEPGTAPKRVNLMTYPGSPYLGPHAGVNPWFSILPEDEDPRQCLTVPRGRMPVLCDLVGVIGADIALTHDGDGAVVALDARGVADPALRHAVATPGAPMRVTFATDLIGEAFEADGGAS